MNNQERINTSLKIVSALKDYISPSARKIDIVEAVDHVLYERECAKHKPPRMR